MNQNGKNGMSERTSLGRSVGIELDAVSLKALFTSGIKGGPCATANVENGAKTMLSGKMGVTFVFWPARGVVSGNQILQFAIETIAPG